VFVASIREQVAQLQAAGLSLNQIARRLGLAQPTVAYHAERLARRAEPRGRNARNGVRPAMISTRKRVAELLTAGLSHIEIAREIGLTKSTVAYHARRLGVPVDDRCARRYDWAEIQRYYDQGHSVTECQEHFGFARAAWNAAVKRGSVVGRPRKLPLDQLLVADTYRSRHNLRRRLVGEGLKPARCERCGVTSWRGEPVPLALHHVNGDRLDNRLENLELLCMNCHGQTPNFSGRSRRDR